MDERTQQLLADLPDHKEPAADSESALDWLLSANEEDALCILRAILSDEELVGRWESPFLQRVLTQLVSRQRRQSLGLSAVDRDQLASRYRQLAARSGREHLLSLLTTDGSSASLSVFADLLVSHPPDDTRSVLAAFSDLFRIKSSAAKALFPRLLDGLDNLALSGLILDFCNFATRKRLLKGHPAAARRPLLISLLGRLSERLGQVQESQPGTASEVDARGRQVAESIALAISLCDALALLGHRDAVGNLYKALELRHRRLRVEAAVALAHLGEKAGEEALVEMAAEPTERLRVLAYAEELQISDRIEEQYTAPLARAEAELAARLARPEQFGIPASRLELLEKRTQFWPGYDHPVDCYLFRFEYSLTHDTYQNIGIAGPVAYNMMADLTGLPIDDLYAIYAGWHVDHEDIYTVPVNQLEGRPRLQSDRLQRFLREAGFQDVRAEVYGSFFGETLLIASAVRDAVLGIALATPDAHEWIPGGNPQRPITAIDVFHIYVGRKLLASFNRQ